MIYNQMDEITDQNSRNFLLAAAAAAAVVNQNKSNTNYNIHTNPILNPHHFNPANVPKMPSYHQPNDQQMLLMMNMAAMTNSSASSSSSSSASLSTSSSSSSSSSTDPHLANLNNLANQQKQQLHKQHQPMGPPHLQPPGANYQPNHFNGLNFNNSYLNNDQELSLNQHLQGYAAGQANQANSNANNLNANAAAAVAAAAAAYLNELHRTNFNELLGTNCFNELNSVQQQPQNSNSTLNVSSSSNENPMIMRSQISSLADVGDQPSLYHSVNTAAASMTRHRY